MSFYFVLSTLKVTSKIRRIHLTPVSNDFEFKYITHESVYAVMTMKIIFEFLQIK